MSHLFLLSPTSRQVSIWRRPKESFIPQSLLQTVKLGCESVMAISWESPSLVIAVYGWPRNMLPIFKTRCIIWGRYSSLMMSPYSMTKTQYTLKFNEHQNEVKSTSILTRSKHNWIFMGRTGGFPRLMKYTNSPLQTVQNLDDSIPSRTGAIIPKPNGGPIPD